MDGRAKTSKMCERPVGFLNINERENYLVLVRFCTGTGDVHWVRYLAGGKGRRGDVAL